MKKYLFIVLPVVAIFCAVSVAHIGFFEFLELKWFDVQFGIRGKISPGANIKIAAIDEKSLKELGQWPWGRQELASLVKNLKRVGAKVVAFDVVFAEADKEGGDRAFADALKDFRGSIVGFFFDGGKKVASRPELADKTSEAYLNVTPDRDGIIRRTQLLIENRGDRGMTNDTTMSSLALAAASKASGWTPLVKKDAANNITGVVLGDRIIPVDAFGRMMINYLGKPGVFPYISAVDIIKGRFDPSQFRDAIVLFGASAAGLSDLRPTPFSSAHAGVEVQANIIDNILTGRFLKRAYVSELLNFAFLVIIGLVSWLIFSRGGILRSVMLEVSLIALILVCGYIFFINGLWVPVVYAVLEAAALFVGIMLLRYFSEGREKRRIYNAFKFYLAPQVIGELLKDTKRLGLGGERREITILFSDVRGFTSISEMIAPDKLVRLMNEYFTRMTDIIMVEGGMVDKYIGDAIMAIFGAPVFVPDHAKRAVCAAEKMQKAVREFEAEAKTKYGLTAFKTGIGINTGEAYVGNMGSSNRFNYTAVGDAVNIASRLEGLTKEHGAAVVVSQSTKEACRGSFEFKPLGLVQVKGKAQELQIFSFNN